MEHNFPQFWKILRPPHRGGIFWGEENIIPIRFCHILYLVKFGEFRGHSLCWSSDGYGSCASNGQNPIPILPARLFIILTSGYILFLISTRFLGFFLVLGSSVRIQMVFNSKESSSLSLIQLQNLLMTFRGSWKAYRESFASICLSES